MITQKFEFLRGRYVFSWFLMFFVALSPLALQAFSPFNNEPTSYLALADLDVTASANTPICAGNTLQLTCVVNSGGGPFTFAWSGPGGFTSNLQNPNRANITVAQAGLYSVTVTETGTGMTGTDNVMVTVANAATANAGADQAKCMNTTVQLSGSFGGAATGATWSASPNVGAFSPNANVLNPTFIPPNNFLGVITFTLTTDDPPTVCDAASDAMTVTWGNPTTVTCDDLVNVSLDENCMAIITPDIALEPDVILDPLYQVEVFTPNGTPLGNVVTGQYIGVTLTIKVTNLCNGNMCSTFMTVSDAIPPVLHCDTLDLSCAVQNFTPAYLKNTLGILNAYPSVFETCSTPVLTYVDTWVDLDCNQSFNGMSDLSGYVRRVWTATDAAGNHSSCTQLLYFHRLHIDDITLPPDVTLSCTNPNTSVSNTGAPSWMGFGHIFPLSPNNAYCEMSATYVDQLTNLCGGTRAIIRTWTIYDFCAPVVINQNPLNYAQVINILDENGPTIDCPDDLTVNMNAVNCCATVDLPDVIITDNCSKVNHAVVYVEKVNPINGNLTLVYNGSASLVNYPGAGLHDTLAVFGNTTCLQPGLHKVSYVAEDNCGNASTCIFYITVIDNVPPVAACDEITQVSLGSDGMILVNALTFDDGSYDNCGMVYFKARRLESNGCQTNNLFHDQVKFCCEDIGDTVTVILRVYDVPVPPGDVSLVYQEEHSNECEVQVYTEDNLKPVCIPPVNVTVSCESFDPSLWAYGMATGVDNCCLDTVTVSTNYNNFDTLCNRGTITRTFRAYDCYGNSNQCTHRIVVNYEQDYYVKFPNDVIVQECNGAGNYGEPEFFGKDCELLGVSFTDEVYTVVPDACFKVERTWHVINWCNYNPNLPLVAVPNPNPSNNSNDVSNLKGPIVSPIQTLGDPWKSTIVAVDPGATPTNYSVFYNGGIYNGQTIPNIANNNGFSYKQIIKVVDTEKPLFVDCPTTPDTICDLSTNDANLWNETYWFDPVTGSQDLCEGAANISITGIDSCSGSNVTLRYLLFLDLDGDGTMETVINSNNPPPAGIVYYNNVNTPNYSGGTPRNFDRRNVSSNQKYRFGLQTFTNNGVKTASVAWNTPASPNSFVAPELPYGKHKIKWYLQDGCGNENTCEYNILVKDCKSPTIVCKDGLSTSIMQTGMVSINLVNFIETSYDNCTPTPLLTYSMGKKTQSTGHFPLVNGNPVTSLTFDCTELGPQKVQIWGLDLAGNSDFCETTLTITDNFNNCSANQASVAGALFTEDIDGVEDSQVKIQGNGQTGSGFTYYQMSDQTGIYQFTNAVPMYSSYTLTPLKNDNPLNGVTTYDLVLISQHILGMQPLNSPYKMIAADANKSGSITTIDIVDLRRLILGITDELPNNNSWRFVDKSFVFSDPSNPFQVIFPESKTVNSIQASQLDEDFVAIKVGDVNGTAIPNTMLQSDNRSAGKLVFNVEDKTVKAGELVTVHLEAEDDVPGYQFTMRFPEMEVVDIVPGAGMSEDNFGIFQDEHMLTTSYFGKEKAAFDVQMRADKDGKLSDLINVSSRITHAEAYNSDGERMDVAFRFQDQAGQSTDVGVGFELYQNIPNPFINKTLIGFHLPEATTATLTVYDNIGRVLYSLTSDYGKGYNAVAIESSVLNSTGMMYYKLETPTHSATCTMIRVQ